MRILFCNIALMRFYQSIIRGIDEPVGGGAWVRREHTASESENFLERIFIYEDGQRDSYCFGSFVQKSARVNLHIERIEGCQLLKDEPSVDGVLVVWCAASHIVGWYKNATVYRNYQDEEYKDEAGNIVNYFFNVEAKADDCVLLPEKDRLSMKWYAPHVNSKGATIGFGQANVWYAQDEAAHDYVEKVIAQISTYDGDNWACGRRIPACVGDHVVVRRGKESSAIEFAFVIEEEGCRPPVHDMSFGKCEGESFIHSGQKYTVTKVEKTEK